MGQALPGWPGGPVASWAGVRLARGQPHRGPGILAPRPAGSRDGPAARACGGEACGLWAALGLRVTDAPGSEEAHLAEGLRGTHRAFMSGGYGGGLWPPGLGGRGAVFLLGGPGGFRGRAKTTAKGKRPGSFKKGCYRVPPPPPEVGSDLARGEGWDLGCQCPPRGPLGSPGAAALEGAPRGGPWHVGPVGRLSREKALCSGACGVSAGSSQAPEPPRYFAQRGAPDSCLGDLASSSYNVGRWGCRVPYGSRRL